MPRAIQSDNGTPFVAVRSRGGLSALSSWWVSLGIKIIRSRVACPQDNGAHERMHADVCAEVQSKPAATLVEQQRVLDRWRQEFNHVRPHEALGGKTPAEVYKVLERRRPTVKAYKYPDRFFVRRVNLCGVLCFRQDRCFLGAALAGLEVGIEVVDAMRVRAWLHDIDLGVVETLPAVDADCFDVSQVRRRKPRPSDAA